MSANSETMNYKLPVFLANDVPSWLTDWNGSMRKIDELIFNANSNISDLETKDTQIENTVNGLNDRVSSVENDLNPSGTGVAKDVASLQTTVDNHTNQLTELDTVTTNLTTLCGNATLQTHNKTLTDAVNEINSQIPIPYTGTSKTITITTDSTKLRLTINFETDRAKILLTNTDSAPLTIGGMRGVISEPDVEHFIKSGILNKPIAMDNEGSYLTLLPFSYTNTMRVMIMYVSSGGTHSLPNGRNYTGIYIYN